MRLSARHIFSVLLLASGLCACNKSTQENIQGVVISAVFSDSDDSSTAVSDLELWFYKAGSGEAVLHHSFGTSTELSDKLIAVPKGKYTVVLGANLSSPLSIDGEGSPDSLNYSLEGTAKKMSFNSCGDYSIEDPSRITEVVVEMKRFLCELAVEMDGAPDGLELSIEAVNGAEAFYPALKGDDGSCGLPSASPKQCSIPTFSLSSAATRSQTFILMPTARGREWSFWRIVMKTPEGKILESYIEAPRMNPGGKYLISLEYTEIQSFMHLSPCTIEDWTQGWVYNGVITDPTTINE